MVLPPQQVNICLKTGDQVFNGGEYHRVFLFANVLVIAFAALVVVPHDAHTIHNVGPAVFVLVCAS
ncbi:hypothetical protein SY86_07395 [Erwinia tracheiphila]|uniref:Uncharacterized protein n=1 Tax=Erwinia tracheiphila TaxID=65700 RepID=A0A0M2KD90_9GAMM|nr:hypothetical protein ETR_04494 [Erwinia tracheiphila PSU-1]KKF35287.1 hypothetical protein SY86_07395 [Erwinia tracheiphila]